MSDRVMIEASMCLHRESVEQLTELARADALGDAFVSDALVRLFEMDPAFAVQLLGEYYGLHDEQADVTAVQAFLANARLPSAEDASSKPGLLRFRRSGLVELQKAYGEINTQMRSEWVTQIVFEEWEFLTTQSWLCSRARKAFETMIEAGATAVEVSKRRLEVALRATLKKRPDQPLSRNDRIRAIAKWVAVGGSSATALIEPVAGTVIAAATNYFLLYDP